MRLYSALENGTGRFFMPGIYIRIYGVQVRPEEVLCEGQKQGSSPQRRSKPKPPAPIAAFAVV